MRKEPARFEVGVNINSLSASHLFSDCQLSLMALLEYYNKDLLPS